MRIIFLTLLASDIVNTNTTYNPYQIKNKIKSPLRSLNQGCNGTVDA